MPIKKILSKIVNNENLTFDEAKVVMDMILDGGATEAQTAAFLVGLRMKGETADEISGLAEVMRKKATFFTPNVPYHIDTVGTGGDGVNTFNISTASAFVAAAAGVTIAKHGNRAISSNCGSTDVLEELGIKIDYEADEVKKCVEETGLGFMFARVFHKKMAQVSKVRSELSMRTVFNILGPVSNPSNAKGQLIGVFDGSLTEVIANVMIKLGIERGMVVHGTDGLDEISITTETKISEIQGGKVVNYSISPEQFGIKRASLADIQGGTPKENAQIIIDIFNGVKSAKRDIVLLNAGASIYIGKMATSIEQGVEIAAQIIDTGKAMDKLNQLRNYR